MASSRLSDSLLDVFSSLRLEDRPGFRSSSFRGSSGRSGGGARFGGGGRSWGGSSGTSSRHDVDRLPELDYFCRKLASVLNDGECPPQWRLPYAKAGAAAGLPDAFSSDGAYLDAMQSTAALEFQASIRQALEQAEREQRRTGVSGWHEFVPQRSRRSGGSLLLDGGESHGTWVFAGHTGVDFEQDSWGRHLVQVRETGSFHLAIMAKQDDETQEHVMALLPTVECSGSASMRTLGFVGPFLAQYEAAQGLRYSLHCSTLPDRTRQLLAAVVRPSTLYSRGAASTLLPAGARLRTDEVPINASQRAAVEALRGGLNIIHGPPGTGKSTTIFHLIDAGVQPDAQVLVTCTRNQAVDSVVDKVARLEGGILVFGNAKRLGERAAQHTLEARVEAHPAVVVWRAGLDELGKYRMHPDICTAISATFYAGKLRTGVGMAARRPAAPACRLLDVRGEEKQHPGAGFSNRQEAEALIDTAVAVARELEGLGVVQAGHAPTLFIVCLYNRQRGLVLDLLNERRGWARLKPQALGLRNVAASKSSGAALSKFFNDARRINVALSRARHLSVVVGSAATMRRAAQREPFWGSILRHYHNV
ncbi:DNA helicase [Chlorella sorokiniana]|uniref:DNA helicase n=1 Tax=Chlorella sorokiniana TaxID=3076 RepID=A0A2P6TVU4_CHLSO|nr:DNA helicase [Chlorella sorokiniana]|eukprot:PRW58176.1 DNA helicase [Chlorella sorokiniana]